MPFIKVITDNGPLYIRACEVRIIAATKVYLAAIHPRRSEGEWVDGASVTVLSGDASECFEVLESADEVYEKVNAALDVDRQNAHGNYLYTDLWSEGMKGGT